MLMEGLAKLAVLHKEIDIEHLCWISIYFSIVPYILFYLYCIIFIEDDLPIIMAYPFDDPIMLIFFCLYLLFFKICELLLQGY